ncbi:hypothetical protein COCCADRAFT_108993, partial [Bipolaris zeicola 26-R-13]
TQQQQITRDDLLSCKGKQTRQKGLKERKRRVHKGIQIVGTRGGAAHFPFKETTASMNRIPELPTSHTPQRLSLSGGLGQRICPHPSILPFSCRPYTASHAASAPKRTCVAARELVARQS